MEAPGQLVGAGVTRGVCSVPELPGAGKTWKCVSLRMSVAEWSSQHSVTPSCPALRVPQCEPASLQEFQSLL